MPTARRWLLRPDACRDLAAQCPREDLFRSRVVMARHGFGRGEYRCFAYPLPPRVERLRTALYPALVPVANRWHEAMGLPVRFPDRHAEFIARCHAAGQTRPTPLLLQYAPDDHHCLHQDLYREHVFPLQVVVLLSAPDQDFTGGEFVMTEQRPRMQPRPMMLPLRQGDAASSRYISAPCRAREASTTRAFATASAACARGSGTRSA